MEAESMVSGPSTPREKRKKTRSKPHSAVKEGSGFTPTLAMDLDPLVQASSSRTPQAVEKTSSSRKKKRSKGTLPAGEPAAATLVDKTGKDQAKVDKVKKREKKEKKLAKKERRREERDKGKRKDEEVWDYVPLAQDQASSIPPIWSRDRKFYFTVSHTSIHIHSSTGPTFKRLSTLCSTHREGHRNRITGIQLHPTNPFQLITCALDGNVKIWDWMEGRLIHTIEVALGGHLNHLCTGQVDGKWFIFATAAIRKEGKSPKPDGSHLRHRVVRLNLPQSKKVDSAEPIRHVGKLSVPPSALFISPSNSYLVALAGNKAYTYRLPSSTIDPAWSPKCVKFVSDQVFTCGLFAPASSLNDSDDEEWFATGDVKGMIRLWHGLSTAFRQLEAIRDGADPSPEQEKRLPTTSLHWHAHAVGALAFSPSGAQLLSAGQESVLVQWHLASGKREYIPRLGGRAIISLAVKDASTGTDEEWWAGMADGTMIRIGASSGQVSNVGQGVRLDPLRPKNASAPYPLALHPPSKSVVLPSSHPSTLQFVDPISSTVQFNLEVSPSNRVSKRDEKELEPIAVDYVAFNDAMDKTQGDRWMATIEGRKGDEQQGGGSVRTLKFWKWLGDRYAVNTQYPQPHDLDDIVSLTFAPARSSDLTADPLLLTCSTSGTAKIWIVRQAKRSSESKAGKKLSIVEKFWTLRNTFSYRDMPIYAACFSPDATIVALAHGSVLSLWDAQTDVLLKTLSGPLETRQMSFITSDGRYLATAGFRSGLSVWDLLSCQAAYTSDTKVSRLVGMPLQDTFVIAAPSDHELWRTTLSIYNATASNPIRQVVVRAKLARLIALPGTQGSDQLEFLGTTLTGEVLRFGDDVSWSRGRHARVNKKEERDTSIWQEMFGKEAFVNLDDTAAATEAASSEVVARPPGRPSEVFDGPSHTLPPPSLLFDSFIDQLLGSSDKPTKVITVDTQPGITYSTGTPIEASETFMVSNAPEVKSRKVTDQEVKEIQNLFTEILSLPTSIPAQPASSKLPNGHGPGTPSKAKANGHVEDHSMTEDAQTDGLSTLSKQARKVSRKLSTRVSQENAVNGASAASDAEAEAHESVVVGKKRKAASRM
ncbi:WD40-repeat-containing domain protein [Kockovaella imperatae]|uniref:WD40-repeat-containing domain protein n=1 Tax=Kockovaella imperatae TaxID=4999 RepID=A0A1Y1UNZ6_9TREE|nr:WD40-repeat-containing domain protein [Kockovaella imperatae]ORX39739.1 WD40-repeat-containing domain protein [Kockovaella imperatae]